jgi:hypothetical protein
LEYVNKERKRTILFLYTVGRIEPRSEGGLEDAEPNSTLQRSRVTSSEFDCGGLTGLA